MSPSFFLINRFAEFDKFQGVKVEPFNQMFGQYNFGDIVIIIILVLICANSLGEALSWAYNTIKGKFRIDSVAEQIIDEHVTLEQ